MPKVCVCFIGISRYIKVSGKPQPRMGEPDAAQLVDGMVHLGDLRTEL